MALESGTQLGPYKITGQLGAGGMGEVYRATDTRLDRRVAVKVLPRDLASDQSRRERFEREARAVSSLNHPHICTLYDVGEQAGTHYLVMELVEGETLEVRLEKGRLPLDQALECAIQIADALDKAHRQGVVHRDLKPANIMLTKSGVKLLDFGLAKLKGDASPASGLSQAPTKGNLTAEGTILGTLQYMAPEQLEGEEADSRTDIFAFGAVVYEMVTGKKAFEGKSQASLISSIMSSEPQPMGELEAMTPASLDHVVRRCLAKDRDDRWQTASDLMREIHWVGEARAEPGPSAGHRPSGGRGRERVAWAVGSVIVLLGGIFIGELLRSPTGSGTQTVAFSVYPPEGTVFRSDGSAPLVPSPDGAQLVAVAVDAEGTARLWVRSLDEDSFQPIPGTEGARNPFWSPESDWIGFYSPGGLRRVRPSGRDPETIVSVSTGLMVGSTDAAWGGGEILFKPGRFENAYEAIPVDGGASRIAAQVTDTAVASQISARFLTDDNRFLFLGLTGPGQQGVLLASLDGSTEPRLLPGLSEEPGLYGRIGYAPGYILFVEGNTLYAMSFDEDEPDNAGERRRIVEGIPVTGGGAAPFAVSSDVLTYWENTAGYAATLQWFGRDGTPGTALVGEARFNGFDLSGDSAVSFSRVRTDGTRDIFRASLDQSGDISVTTDGDSTAPVWSNDGSRIAFASARGQPPVVHTERTVTQQENGWPTEDLMTFPRDWSPDDDVLVYDAIDEAGRADIAFLHIDEERHERFARNTPDFNESFASISPDGEWILWVTDESGVPQVWADRYPTLDEPRFIANGDFPKWRSDGGEIYFVSDGVLMARRVADSAANLELEESEEILNLAELGAVFSYLSAPYEPSPDGQRFLVHVRSTESQAPPVKVIVNWASLIEEE